MIFELVGDLVSASTVFPTRHRDHQILSMLEKALRRDTQFVGRHPTMLFQCIWNACWWYDCPEAAQHYDAPEEEWGPEGAPWTRQGRKLCSQLEDWYEKKEAATPGFCWARSLLPPPVYLGNALQSVLRGQGARITCLTYSHDGRVLASGDEDGSVRIWSIDSGAQLLVLYCDGRSAAATDLAFDAGGSRLVSGTSDGSIYIWDARAGCVIHRMTGHVGCINRVCISHDGRRIASAGEDRCVRLWNVEDGGVGGCYKGHVDVVNDVQFLPDGRVVSVSADGTVRFWSSHTAAQEHRIAGHRESVNCVAISPDGTWVVTGSDDGYAIVWSASHFIAVLRLPVGEDGVRGVAFANDGRRVFATSKHGTTGIWCAVTGKELERLHRPCRVGAGSALSPDQNSVAVAIDDEIQICRISYRLKQGNPNVLRRAGLADAVAVSPDGHLVATATPKKPPVIHLWHAATGFEFGTLPGHRATIRDLAFGSTWQQLASASDDGTVKVWDLASRPPIRSFDEHFYGVQTVRFFPNRKATIACGGLDAKLRIWDIIDRVYADHSSYEHSESITSLSIASDEQSIAYGTNGGSIFVCDFQGTEHLIEHSEYAGNVEVALSHDGTTVAYSRPGSPHKNGFVKIISKDTGHCVRLDLGYSDPLSVLARERDDSAICATVHAGETVASLGRSKAHVAWLHSQPSVIRSEFNGRLWAAIERKHFLMFRIEGELPEIHRKETR